MKDTSSSKTKPQADGLAPFADFSPWFDTYKQAAESWSQTIGNYFKSNMELGQELSSFVQSRLQADAEAMKDLFTCRNPTDFAKVQQAFLSKATDAYTNEAGKIAARTSAIMKDSTAALSSLSASTH